MVDPNGRVGQNQAGSDRRRGMSSRLGIVPPSEIRWRTASRSIRAFSASRTSAVFSSIPVYSWARFTSSSSIASVVRMPHLSIKRCRIDAQHACKAPAALVKTGNISIKQIMQPDSPTPPPLILTLAVDDQAQADFEHQRRRYYPATLNRIPAHISLFHALPGDELPSICQQLLDHAAATTPFAIQVHDIKKLGRGVAYALQADPLDDLHAHLRKAWLPWLTPQDAQGFRPPRRDPKQGRPTCSPGSLRQARRQLPPLLHHRNRFAPVALSRKAPGSSKRLSSSRQAPRPSRHQGLAVARLVG